MTRRRRYFVNFLQRTDWHRQSGRAVVDEQGRTDPLAALDQLRSRIRTRHHSYRTECSYVDWVRRFLAYVAEQQGVPQPRVEPASIRDFLTYTHVVKELRNPARSPLDILRAGAKR